MFDKNPIKHILTEKNIKKYVFTLAKIKNKN